MAESSEIGKKGRKKCVSARRTWSFIEEEALVIALSDLCTQGWKFDNGFRGGYLNIIEQAMNRRFPGTDLKAQPHIHSKVQSWKKYYAVLFDLVDKSGLGWDDTDKMIHVEDNMKWEEFCKKEPNARTMRYKRWPFFNEWCNIFGKDRATGALMSDFESLAQQTQSGNQDNGPPPSNASGFVGDNEVETQSELRPVPPGPSEKKGKMKRKDMESAHETFATALNNFNANTSEVLSRIIGRFGHDEEISTSRKSLMPSLLNIGWLTIEDRVKVMRYLVNSQGELEQYYRMSEPEQNVFVRIIWTRIGARSDLMVESKIGTILRIIYIFRLLYFGISILELYANVGYCMLITGFSGHFFIRFMY